MSDEIPHCTHGFPLTCPQCRGAGDWETRPHSESCKRCEGRGIIATSQPFPTPADIAEADSYVAARGNYVDRKTVYLDAIHTRDAEVAALRAQVAELERERIVRWRCFHCGDTFTQEQFTHAREHFGHDEGETPVCLMRVPGESGLIAALRKAQDELTSWRAECDPLTRAIEAQAADYEQRLIREEEKGYARGLKDYMKVEAERDHLRAELTAIKGTRPERPISGEI